MSHAGNGRYSSNNAGSKSSSASSSLSSSKRIHQFGTFDCKDEEEDLIGSKSSEGEEGGVEYTKNPRRSSSNSAGMALRFNGRLRLKVESEEDADDKELPLEEGATEEEPPVPRETGMETLGGEEFGETGGEGSSMVPHPLKMELF